MTAAIFEKTWTVRASAAKAAQRAGLAKGSYIIAECNGEFAILELEAEQGDKMKPKTATPGFIPAGEEPAKIAADRAAALPQPAEETRSEATARMKAEDIDHIAKIIAPRPANASALPTPPDFSKPSHAPYRKRLAAMIAMAEAGDDVGLVALTFKVERSSQKIMARYRDACLKALGA